MKRSKKIIIGVGSGIGIIIILLSIFMIKMYTETSKMFPVPTKEIINGIYSIKDDFVNVYIIKANDKYIAIDAGKNMDTIKQEMEKLNIDNEKVIAVFLTHTDTDHVAGLGLFKNASIYISKEEEQMINGQTHRFFIINNKLASTYELLNNDQVLNISGMEVKGISTPGHTPGSMCYLINGKYLFTGDSFSLKNGATDIFNEIFNMDSQTQRRSLKKLAGLSNVKYIFSAHYGFTDDFDKAFQKWK